MPKRSFSRNEDGLALTEYLMLLGLLSGLVMFSVGIIGNSLSSSWSGWSSFYASLPSIQQVADAATLTEEPAAADPAPTQDPAPIQVAEVTPTPAPTPPAPPPTTPTTPAVTPPPAPPAVTTPPATPAPTTPTTGKDKSNPSCDNSGGKAATCNK